MNDRPSTKVVLLTPQGRAAVASLLVIGPRATEIVSQSFLPASNAPLDQREINHIVFGRWGGPQGEEVVVVRRGPERVEIHAHGGSAAIARIIEDLARLGCRVATWQEWTNENESDQIAAAAHVMLADVQTERAAAILLNQLDGALRNSVDQILAAVRAHNASQARRRLEELLSRADMGRHLAKPWRVVLAGPPNVGKSSLINALVGYSRAIVHDTPGTTRDALTAVTAFDGWPVELTDTAGLRASDDPIEAAGVSRAEGQLAAADAVLLVFDLTLPWTDDSQRLIESRPSAIVVHNKCDLEGYLPDRPAGIIVSAVRGDSMELLERKIVDTLIPQPPPAGAAVPFTKDQIRAFSQALDAVKAGQWSTAAELLEALPGGTGC